MIIYKNTLYVYTLLTVQLANLSLVVKHIHICRVELKRHFDVTKSFRTFILKDMNRGTFQQCIGGVLSRSLVLRSLD